MPLLTNEAKWRFGKTLWAQQPAFLMVAYQETSGLLSLLLVVAVAAATYVLVDAIQRQAECCLHSIGNFQHTPDRRTVRHGQFSIREQHCCVKRCRTKRNWPTKNSSKNRMKWKRLEKVACVNHTSGETRLEKFPGQERHPPPKPFVQWENQVYRLTKHSLWPFVKSFQTF